MYQVSICPKHKKPLVYWRKTDTHTLFICPELDCEYKSEGVVHSNLPQKYNALKTEIAQLKGEKPLPGAYWKECPNLAQRTMERIIDTNNKLQAKNKKLVEALQNLVDYTRHPPKHLVDNLHLGNKLAKQAEQALAVKILVSE